MKLIVERSQATVLLENVPIGSVVQYAHNAAHSSNYYLVGQPPFPMNKNDRQLINLASGCVYTESVQLQVKVVEAIVTVK